MIARDRDAWRKAICRSALPSPARLVAQTLAVYIPDPAGLQGVWLSSSDLARATGLKSLSTVNTHLRRLAEEGWLRKNDGAWFLTWPGELDLIGERAG